MYEHGQGCSQMEGKTNDKNVKQKRVWYPFAVSVLASAAATSPVLWGPEMSTVIVVSLCSTRLTCTAASRQILLYGRSTNIITILP